MEVVLNIIDFIIHLDRHLNEIIQAIGGWSYLLLFVIVFAETGLVITPFLPGDSLLFVVGTFAALGMFDPLLVFIVLLSAAVIGDTVNYAVGKYFGDRILLRYSGRFFKKEYVDDTHRFFERHGGKTIILARFVPIIRTFAPFVAGIGKMEYRKFIIYNITGALLWVAIFLFGGYFFGNIPLVKDNFVIAIFGMMLVSLLPVFIGFAKKRKK
ncbi:MAG: DedA family protein [Candidatus Omnitrophota bacterium]|jgi:membrane-associated protein